MSQGIRVNAGACFVARADSLVSPLDCSDRPADRGRTVENTVAKNPIRFGATVAALLWTNAAFACDALFPWLPPCGSGTAVPEIDAGAGIMALALVAGVAALIYSRSRE